MHLRPFDTLCAGLSTPLRTVALLYLLSGLLAPTLFAQRFMRVFDAGTLVSRQQSNAWGSSWGDFNNDGFMDLFVVGQPNELHINNGDGTFTSLNGGHAVTFRGNQNSALWADYDNDGYLDLYVNHLGPGTPVPPGGQLNPRPNFLYRNGGPPAYSLLRTFDPALIAVNNMTWTSSWSDYDNDGDIDLFVGGDQGDQDLFFENKGDGSFTRITDQPFLNPGEFSAGGSWVDLDADGDEDLFVVNFMRTNNELYRNTLSETGTLGFEEVAGTGIVNDFEDDLVPSWGDYDNDGDLDAFMAVWNNRNNALFRNDGDLGFTRIREGIVVNDQGWSLGNAWLDYDNDGDLDLFVVDQQSADRLYRNDGDGTFTKMTTAEVGILVATDVGAASGAAVADYDNDGDLDLFIPTSGGPHLLMRNDGGNENNWIHITPVGDVSNRSAIGAKVRVKATIGGRSYWQLRVISGNPSGDRAQSSMRAHFGLGDAALIDSLQILWPSGLVDTYEAVEVNQFFTSMEGEAPTPVANDDTPELPQAVRLDQNYPNPFNPTTTIRYHLPSPLFVTLTIYDMLGREMARLVHERQLAGTHEIRFEKHAALRSGLYVYRLQAGTTIEVKRMALIR